MYKESPRCFNVVKNLVNFIETDRIHDFDLVREDSAGSCSKNVFFDGKIISDYFRSDKNRAVTIDDFSGEFRSDPNLDVFVVIDSFFGNTIRTCKSKFYDDIYIKKLSRYIHCGLMRNTRTSPPPTYLLSSLLLLLLFTL